MTQSSRTSRLTHLMAHVSLAVMLAGLCIIYGCGAFQTEGLKDFGSFIASGRAALAGRNPYSDQEPLVLTEHFESIDLELRSPNLNPPVSVFLFQMLAPLEPSIALTAWRLLSLFLYGLSLVAAIRLGGQPVRPLQILWACCLFGLWHMIKFGQVYAAIQVLCTAALFLMRYRRPLAAGLAIGTAVALKPNLGLWLILLLAEGQIATSLAAIAVCVVISLLPVLVYGPEIYAQWLSAVRGFNGGMVIVNGSLQNLCQYLDIAAVWAYVLSIALLLTCVWLIWKHRPPAWTIGEPAILLSLLAAPVAWPGYIILVIPWLLAREWDWPTYVAAALLAVPAILPIWRHGWPMLILLLRAMWQLSGSNLRWPQAQVIKSG